MHMFVLVYRREGYGFVCAVMAISFSSFLRMRLPAVERASQRWKIDRIPPRVKHCDAIVTALYSARCDQRILLEILFRQIDPFARANVQWHTLMQLLRTHIRDVDLPRGCAASRLFRNEREWRRLIEQTQLPVRALAVRRVHENSAVQQGAMHVCDERADVARRERLRIRAVRILQMIHQRALPRRPVGVVAFIHAVDALTGIRNANIGMAEQELTDRRIQREAVHAVSRRIYEHRRRAVHHVTRGHLLAPHLQAVLLRTALAIRDLALDGEDGADRYVRIDVR